MLSFKKLNRDEYALNILINTLNNEKLSLSTDFLLAPNDSIKPYMREKLVQWMIQDFQPLNVSMKTVENSIALLNRILSVTQLQKNQLQLVGAICMKLSVGLYETFDYTLEHVKMQCGDQYLSLIHI
eukprot:TRINITY_DN4026_c0_g1_i7.p1 TRINITY_DN4026_c0_g1~~TRINITY_DN4026_c0_g1_i7.p1  ORF type:complete len:127 (-),score=14.82 TRINITY_DN4026_c0_g1_i7:61-441(-)